MKRLPLILLAFAVLRHYVWPLFPDALQTSLWTMCSSFVVIAGISALTIIGVWLGAPVMTTLAVSAWWVVEEVVVIGCELAYLFNGLSPTGDERCTAQLGVKFSAFGLVMVSVLLLAVMSDSGAAARGKHNVD